MLDFTLKSQKKSLPTLLCIHGFLGNMNDFLSFLSPLSTSYNLLGIALPYHDSSSEQSQSIQSFSQGISEVLDHCNLKEVSAYGYSMGGRVLLSFAYYFPERVSELFVESSHPGFNTLDSLKTTFPGPITIANLSIFSKFK